MSTYKKIKAPKGMPFIPPTWLMKLMFKLNVPGPVPEPPFTKPDNWADLTSLERRNLRFDVWESGKGIKFANPQAEADYKERAKLIRDAITMDRKPDRVPVFTFVGVYPQRRLGLNPKGNFYDKWKDAAVAHIQFFMDLKPDVSTFAQFFSGPALELLDNQILRWPGHDLPSDSSFQYLEQEFMKAEEYPLLLINPSDYLMRVVAPRKHKALSGLSKMPEFSAFTTDGLEYMSFLDPEVQDALKKLRKVAELSSLPLPSLMAGNNGPQIQGFPAMFGSIEMSPFDNISAYLRGSRGIMTDMYRHKEELIEACELFAQLAIEAPVREFNACPMVFMPLHKGSDRFMSEEQFETFYWPSLKKVILAMHEDGYIPTIFAEGGYNNRLEYITEFPRGGALWWFDQTDMTKVSEAFQDKLPYMGNVPASLTTTGTPEQMTAYCKNLIETCGPSGNFVLTNGVQIDEARDENLKAMIDSVKQFIV